MQQFYLSALALAAAVAANGVPPPPPKAYTGDIRIEAFRHGETCANFVYDCKPDGVDWTGCVKPARNIINAGDSILTRAGLLGSKAVGEKIANLGSGKGKPDIVFVSNMMSTMETAMEMFPGRVLYVAPYIVDTNLDNRPQPLEEQLRLMRQELGSKVDKLDFTFMDEIMVNEDKDCRDGQESARCTADFGNFLDWFASKITDPVQLATLPKLLQDKINNQQDIVLAISGHGTQNRHQIINADKSYKITANMGHYADYKLFEDTDGDQVSYYLDRVDDDDSELWPAMDDTLYYDVDECESNNYDILDRCYVRNPGEYNIILGSFENPYDGCPSEEDTFTIDQYPVQQEPVEPVSVNPVVQEAAESPMSPQARKLDESKFSSKYAQLILYNGETYVFGPETEETN